MIVAALVTDPISRARLTDALRHEASVRYCERLSEVTAMVEAGLANLVVVEHRDRDGSPALPVVRRLRDGFPSVPIVMYVPMSAVVSGAVMEYAKAGVSQLVFQGVDDLKASLRSAIDAAHRPGLRVETRRGIRAAPSAVDRCHSSGIASSMRGAISPSRKWPPRWVSTGKRSWIGCVRPAFRLRAR